MTDLAAIIDQFIADHPQEMKAFLTDNNVWMMDEGVGRTVKDGSNESLRVIGALLAERDLVEAGACSKSKDRISLLVDVGDRPYKVYALPSVFRDLVLYMVEQNIYHCDQVRADDDDDGVEDDGGDVGVLLGAAQPADSFSELDVHDDNVIIVNEIVWTGDDNDEDDLQPTQVSTAASSPSSGSSNRTWMCLLMLICSLNVVCASTTVDTGIVSPEGLCSHNGDICARHYRTSQDYPVCFQTGASLDGVDHQDVTACCCKGDWCTDKFVGDDRFVVQPYTVSQVPEKPVEPPIVHPLPPHHHHPLPPVLPIDVAAETPPEVMEEPQEGGGGEQTKKEREWTMWEAVAIGIWAMCTEVVYFFFLLATMAAQLLVCFITPDRHVFGAV